MNEITAAMAGLDLVFKNISKGKEPTKGLENIGVVATSDGSLTKFLSEFTITPTIVITRYASMSKVIIQDLSELAVDTFTGYYLQAFHMLSNLYGLDAKNTLKVLSTGTGLRDLKNKTSRDINGLIKGVSDLTYERATKDNVSTLTLSASGKEIFSIEATSSRDNDKDTGTNVGFLRRDVNIKIKTAIMNNNGEEKVVETKIPITISANIVYTETDSIKSKLVELSKGGPSVRWGDWSANLISTAELLLSSSYIEEYKKARVRKVKDELIDTINNRKISSLARAGDIGARGFEANYNSYIITSDEADEISSYIGADILSSKGQEMINGRLGALNFFVIDNDEEMVVSVTSNIPGISTARFKDIPKKKSKDGDITDLVKLMLTQRSMF